MVWPSGGRTRTGDAAWKRRRIECLVRDGYACVRCGLRSPSGVGLEADHVVEHADGGTDDLTNLRTLCARCHRSRTAASTAARNRQRAARRRRPTEQHPGLR